MRKKHDRAARRRRPPPRRSETLEPAYWQALVDIGRREALSLPDLCRFIRGRDPDRPLAAAIRLFVTRYFRWAAEQPPAGSAVTPDVAA